MPERRHETLLAFDFGLRRIGIASGDTITGSASPLTTVARTATGPDWSAIAHEIRALKPSRLVVGRPYNSDGTPGSLAAATDAFAAELATRHGLPVLRVDERHSSREATAELKARRASGQRRRRVQKEDIDSVAAAIILGRWLQGGESTN
jgi:putative Holliday junction resolvase